MPIKSQAQRGYIHSHPEKFGGTRGVAEWEAATPKGKKLPKHVKSTKRKRGR